MKSSLRIRMRRRSAPQTSPPLWWQFPWAPLATVLGGFLALSGLYYAQYKTQQQFMKAQDANWRQFQIKAANDEFADILDRLANKDMPFLRANAAMRLSDMAMRPLPGKETDPVAENFPFFPRALSQLAAALRMEPDREVRREVVKALGRMAKFGQQGRQELLDLQIRELADTNRQALSAFIDALGKYEVLRPGSLGTLANFTLFCPADRQATTIKCLEDLASSQEGENARTRSSQRLEENSASRAEESKSISALVEHCGEVLRDSRDALVDALLLLDKPEKAGRDLPLSGIFLAGAYRTGDVHLEGADLDGSYLECVNFDGIYLTKARLRNAFLKGADLSDAHLQGATLARAEMEAADIGGADLSGAYLFGAMLTVESFSRPAVSKGQQDQFANFKNTDWWEADEDSWSGDKGTRLLQWLYANYPPPPGTNLDDIKPYLDALRQPKAAAPSARKSTP